MEIQFQCNLRDYLEAQRTYYWRSVRGVIAACLLAGCALLGGVLTMLGSSNGYPLLIILICWLMIVFIWRPWYFRRDFRKHPNFSREQTAHISEGGVLYKNEVSQSEVKWEAFVKFRETRNLFMLFSGGRLFHIVPKRAFSETGVDEFRELLQRHLSKK